MLVPYSWLKEFVNIKASPDKVAERLSLASIGVEEVRRVGKDYVLDLEVTYNRGDLLSILGVARELAALYNLKLTGEESEFGPPGKIDKISVKSDKELSPLYTATLIQNLSYTKTPGKIKRYLEVTGMRSVNLFADITNFVMLEYGQPLHAFDAGKLRKRDKAMVIEVRRARKGEKITTIDGSTHNLRTSDVVIADRRGPIAVAGVMGGKDTEVDLDTKEILLEAAIFDPLTVRKTARRLGLVSEASTRFEHFLSPKNLYKALHKAIQLYQLYGKGKVAAFGRMEKGEAIKAGEGVNLTSDKLGSLLGATIDIKEARRILEQLGFKVMSSDRGLLAWPPHFRGDIVCEEDLIEEVARIYGYENLPSTPPYSPVIDAPLNEFERFRDKVSCLLAGFGCDEVKTYSFFSSGALIHSGTDKLHRIKNPISAETEYLRDTAILNLLEIAKANCTRDAEGRVFELEKVYPAGKDEHYALSSLVWGETDPYRVIKGVLEALLDQLFVETTFKPTELKYAHPKRGAEVVVGNTVIGAVGELHPHLAESCGVKGAAFFEIIFEKLAKLAEQWGEYAPIPKYHEVYEDFSFFLPGGKQLGLLIERIRDVDNTVRDVRLSDIFDRGGKRSITLQVVFQSGEKELSSDDLAPLRRKITKLIKKSGGGMRT